jgi:hypothetical protein
MSLPILRAEGLRYAYRGVPAVQEVSLSVGEGEVVALLGGSEGPARAGRGRAPRRQAGGHGEQGAARGARRSRARSRSAARSR